MARFNVIRPQDYVRAELPDDPEATSSFLLWTIGSSVAYVAVGFGLCMCVMVEDVGGR